MSKKKTYTELRNALVRMAMVSGLTPEEVVGVFHSISVELEFFYRVRLQNAAAQVVGLKEQVKKEGGK